MSRAPRNRHVSTAAREGCSQPELQPRNQVITATAVREGGSQATDLCRMMEAMGMAGVEVRLPAGGCPGEMAKEVQVVCWERKRA